MVIIRYSQLSRQEREMKRGRGRERKVLREERDRGQTGRLYN